MPNDNSFSDRQHLSDLLDGHNSNNATSLLLADSKNARRWYRYQMVQDVIRQQFSAHSSYQFTRSVSAKIAVSAEAAEQISADNINNHSDSNKIIVFPRKKRFFGGLAVAASVALVTVLSVQMPVEQANHPAANIVETDGKIDNQKGAKQQQQLDRIQQVLDNLGRDQFQVNEKLVGQEVAVQSFIVKQKAAKQSEKQGNSIKQQNRVEKQNPAEKIQDKTPSESQ